MFNKIVLSLLFLTFSHSAFASKQIEWEDLRPEVSPHNIVLPNLTSDQIDKLKQITRLKQSTNPDQVKRGEQLKNELLDQNIDADEVLRLHAAYVKAEQAKAEALTDQYDGENVRIAGFLVPLEFSDMMVATEFLLVPTAGACIHVPPPPANQIIKVSYPDGYKLKHLRLPVWVEGKVSSDIQTDSLYIVDGETNITMGYQMDATLVTDYD